MLATLGVLGAENVVLALVHGRPPSSESVDLVLFATSGLIDSVSFAAGGAVVVGSVRELATSSDVILVAAEAADTVDALKSLAPFLGEHHVVIVSSADIGLDHLRRAVGADPALLRVVSDPGGLEDGVLLMSAEPGTTPEALERSTRALAGIGAVELLPEDLLESARAVIGASKGCLVTALAGIEEGAVAAGLPEDVARSFVRQTALATALLLQDHSGSPADLKDQVASPGGTTIAGLAVLEDLGVRGAFIRAVQAAAVRARETRDVEQSHVVE